MTRGFIILFMFVFDLAYAQQKEFEQTEIPFTLTSDGHIIILAKVNGVAGKFVFDTGAGMNLLTQDFADSIEDLEETNHFITGHRATGEEIQSDIWRSKSIAIGSFEVKDAICAVYDFDFPLDGLISLTSFLDRAVTIDFENKILSIESEKTLGAIKAKSEFVMPLQIFNDRGIDVGISTHVKLNGKLALNVKLDSGAGSGVYRFSSRYMDDLGIDSTKIDSEYRPSFFKPDKGNTYYFTSLSQMSDAGKNVLVKNFKATFIDGLIYEGIMSIDWIGKKITIDMADEKLFVQN